MSDLIGKYDICGILDRFKARYGIEYLQRGRYQGKLEDFMDPDDPDRATMIAFRDELENGDRRRLQSEQFERELMAAMYERQSIDALADLMCLDRDQMTRYFKAHRIMNYHRKRMRAKANQVVIVRSRDQITYAASDHAVAKRLGISVQEVRNVLAYRHQPPKMMHGVQIKRRLWYEADGGFD